MVGLYDSRYAGLYSCVGRMGVVIGGGVIGGGVYVAYEVINLEAAGYHCRVYQKPPNL